MGKTKTKKFRGSARHGRGRKGGRGKGLRGGSGNAGLHKHKYASTVIKEKQGIRMFGRHGFKRPTGTVFAEAVMNVGDLAVRFPGQATVNLADHGVTKLLGAGEVATKLTLTVESASAQAVEKVQAAGGAVNLTRPKKPKKARAPKPSPAQAEAAAKAAAPPKAAAPAKPAKTAPEPKKA